MSSVSRAVVDRNQRVLSDLNKQPGNDICADCKAKGPRWASHNLGIFLCVHCAGIHRKIGTHVTKVKSVSMDSWSKEQVEVMKSTGNIASNSRYNPNESRHPAPGNREGSGKDDEMEKYIRAKYEFKRFMVKPQSQLSADNPNAMTRKSSPAPPPPPPPSSQAQPYPVSSFPQMAPTVTPQATPSSQPSMPSTAPAASVWNDLMSLSSESTQSVAPSYGGNPQTAAAVPVASPGVSPFPQMPNLSGSPFGTQAVFTRSPSTSTSALSSQHLTQGLHFSQPISGQAAPFIQNTATVHPFNQPAAGGISAASHPLLYPQQTLLQTQGHSHAFGTAHNSAPGNFHPSLYQQQVSVPNQAYAQGPYGFDPSFRSQQPPLPVQNDVNYLQWQQTQAGFSSTPQSNQWTS